jgi:two-component system chemotaxis response regulator CheB
MRVQRVTVVVVENSASQRAQLVRLLQAEGDITVVGQASNATDAVSLIEHHRPNVVTVDLDIAEGGGQFVIEHVMANTPTPILVLSAAVQNEKSENAVQALVGGALVALPKPVKWTEKDESHIRRTIRSINRVPVIRHPRGRLRSPVRKVDIRRGQRVVAIAASTGGPASLAKLLSDLAGLRAPVLIVQHLHRDFTEGLATWMARVSALPVEVARDQQELQAGRVYIAPGDVHLRLGGGRRVELSASPKTVHRPSADVLFNSVAEHAGPDGIGVILSGMGDDGARGLLAMHRQGASTLGQDELSCAVFGMPRAAARLGAVTDLMPPEAIAVALRRLVGSPITGARQ